MKIKSIIVFLLVALVLGCTGVEEKKTETVKTPKEKTEMESKEQVSQEKEIKIGNITINIVDEEGNSLSGEVILESEEGKKDYEESGDMVEFKDIEQGLYGVKVKKEGYISTTKYANISDKDITKKIVLKKEYPNITVIPELNGEDISATVEVSKDGKLIDKDSGNFINFQLDKGIYQVKVSGPYIISTTKYINVGNSDSEIKVKVRRGSNLVVKTEDSNGNIVGGTVELKKDGKVKDIKSEESIIFNKLPVGTYSITFMEDGYTSTTKYVELGMDDLIKEIKLKVKELHPHITVIPILDDIEVEATVEVLKDGEIIDADSGRFINFQLDKGIYGVKVSGPYIISTTKYINVGTEDQEVEIEVRRGTKVIAKLKDSNGESIEGTVELKKDGNILDVKSGKEVEFAKLPAGTYGVTAKKEGYFSTTKYVFAMDMISQKELVLRKSSELTVIPTSDGKEVEAEVEISQDGKTVKKGSGSKTTYKLEDGIYEVKVYSDIYNATTKYVSLDENSELKIPVERINKLKVNVLDENSSPLNSDILLKSDNKIVRLDTGDRTVFQNLKNGIYEVVIKTEEYNSVSKFVNINNANKTVDVMVKNKKSIK